VITDGNKTIWEVGKKAQIDNGHDRKCAGRDRRLARRLGAATMATEGVPQRERGQGRHFRDVNTVMQVDGRRCGRPLFMRRPSRDKVERINMTEADDERQERLAAGRIDVMHWGALPALGGRLNRAGGALRFIASLKKRDPAPSFPAPSKRRPTQRRHSGSAVRLGERRTVTLATASGSGCRAQDVTRKEYGGGIEAHRGGQSGGSRAHGPSTRPVTRIARGARPQSWSISWRDITCWSAERVVKKDTRRVHRDLLRRFFWRPSEVGAIIWR